VIISEVDSMGYIITFMLGAWLGIILASLLAAGEDE